MKYGVFEPALLLLTTLGSFPFVVYCLRFVGAAAFRVKRNEQRVPVAVLVDEQWAMLMFTFSTACIIAGGAVWAVNLFLDVPALSELGGGSAAEDTLSATAHGGFASGHGVFAAVLVGTIWPLATKLLSRALLLAYLACIGAALIITEAQFPAAVLTAYVTGFGAASLATCVLSRQR